MSLAFAASCCGILMALAPLFQVTKILKRGTSADVSIGTTLILLLGFSVWLAYGVSLTNIPLIVTNGASWIMAVITIAVVMHHRPTGCLHAPGTDTRTDKCLQG